MGLASVASDAVNTPLTVYNRQPGFLSCARLPFFAVTMMVMIELDHNVLLEKASIPPKGDDRTTQY